MGVTHTQTGWNRGNWYSRDNRYSPTASLWKSCPIQAILHDPRVGQIWRDDFTRYDPTLDWAVVEDAAATQTLTDAVDGVLTLADTAVDNEEQYLSSIAENWLLVAGNPVWFEAFFTLTEANVDDANICFGISDNAAADLMVDDGASMAANFDGVMLYKADGGTVWQLYCSNGAAQTVVANVGAFTSGVAQRVGFVYDGAGTVTPYVNGVAGTASITNLPAGSAMHAVMGLKAGDANAETLAVDYMQIASIRT